jgi:hypothetical protein
LFGGSALMKTNLAKYVCGLLLLVAINTTTAQTTWNYFVSDAGDGNSLATPPGDVLMISESSLAVSVNAPGIYADSYAASGTPQSIPTLDGSSFQRFPASVYSPISLYDTGNAPGNGDDSFGLISPLPPHTGPGTQLLYHPGTQSALIPVDFSNFNPGTYQSEQSGFSTPLTVKLTVSLVPEPSSVALAIGAAIGVALTNKKGRTIEN